MARKEDLGDPRLVWSGRPSANVYYSIYAAFSIVAVLVVVATEIWVSGYTRIGRVVFPTRLEGIGQIPYPVEVTSAMLVLFVFFC